MSLEEWDAVVQAPHGPHFITSPKAVVESVRKLERALRSASDPDLMEGPPLPPPSAVTLARSTDLYMPLELGPLIEREVLDMLSRLGWGGAAEAGGDVRLGAEVPVWPDGVDILARRHWRQ